jgi:hypothetical protein
MGFLPFFALSLALKAVLDVLKWLGLACGLAPTLGRGYNTMGSIDLYFKWRPLLVPPYSALQRRDMRAEAQGQAAERDLPHQERHADGIDRMYGGGKLFLSMRGAGAADAGGARDQGGGGGAGGQGNGRAGGQGGGGQGRQPVPQDHLLRCR